MFTKWFIARAFLLVSSGCFVLADNTVSSILYSVQYYLPRQALVKRVVGRMYSIWEKEKYWANYNKNFKLHKHLLQRKKMAWKCKFTKSASWLCKLAQIVVTGNALTIVVKIEELTYVIQNVSGCTFERRSVERNILHQHRWLIIMVIQTSKGDPVISLTNILKLTFSMLILFIITPFIPRFASIMCCGQALNQILRCRV